MAHRGKEGGFGGISSARLVARGGELNLGPFALGDVLDRTLQIGGVILDGRDLGPQIQGPYLALGRYHPMIEVDLVALQAAAQSPRDGSPIRGRNSPQYVADVQRAGVFAEPQHPAQLGRAFEQLPVWQPAKVADAGDALRLGKALLADDQISQRIVGAQHVTHPVRQYRPVDRLANKIRRADAVGAVDRIDVVERGRHQHRRIAAARQGADRLTHLEAAHLRHHHVEDDEIGFALVERFKRCQAVFRLDDLEAFRLQHLPLQKPFGLVIVGDQDQRARPLRRLRHQATRGRRAVRAACAC